LERILHSLVGGKPVTWCDRCGEHFKYPGTHHNLLVGSLKGKTGSQPAHRCAKGLKVRFQVLVGLGSRTAPGGDGVNQTKHDGVAETGSRMQTRFLFVSKVVGSEMGGFEKILLGPKCQRDAKCKVGPRLQSEDVAR